MTRLSAKHNSVSAARMHGLLPGTDRLGGDSGSHLSSWYRRHVDMLVKMPDSSAKAPVTVLRPLAASTPVPASTPEP